MPDRAAALLSRHRGLDSEEPNEPRTAASPQLGPQIDPFPPLRPVPLARCRTCCGSERERSERRLESVFRDLGDASSYSTTPAGGTDHRGRGDAVAVDVDRGGGGAGEPRSLSPRPCGRQLGLVGGDHCRCETPAVTDRDSLLASPLADHGRGWIRSHVLSVPEMHQRPNLFGDP